LGGICFIAYHADDKPISSTLERNCEKAILIGGSKVDEAVFLVDNADITKFKVFFCFIVFDLTADLKFFPGKG
jgi:hypothetical protein